MQAEADWLTGKQVEADWLTGTQTGADWLTRSQTLWLNGTGETGNKLQATETELTEGKTELIEAEIKVMGGETGFELNGMVSGSELN